MVGDSDDPLVVSVATAVDMMVRKLSDNVAPRAIQALSMVFAQLAIESKRDDCPFETLKAGMLTALSSDLEAAWALANTDPLKEIDTGSAGVH